MTNPTTTALSDRFRRMVDMVETRLVLKPLLEAYLVEARFPDRFSVTFHKAGLPRPPDGWFHPSTHPRWTSRQLYYYLTEPEQVQTETLSYESRMAVTMGTAVHGFIQMCIREAGYMVPLEGTCPVCQRPRGTGKDQCDEYGTQDPASRSRGHMDGIVNIMLTGYAWQPGIGGFEFKTSNPNKARGLEDGDLETFIAKWPEYYDQVQEYMETSGLRQFIVIVAVLGFPWRLIEIQVPYDAAHAMTTRAGYRQALEAVEAGIAPSPPCCAPRSATARDCPVRTACPIGRL